MTIDEAIRAADGCAAVVWRNLRAPRAFRWSDTMEVTLDDLARFVEAHPEAPAEAVYIHAMRTAGVSARSWREARSEVRTALEIFRATFLTLRRLAAAEAGEQGVRSARSGRLDLVTDDVYPQIDQRERLI